MPLEKSSLNRCGADGTSRFDPDGFDRAFTPIWHPNLGRTRALALNVGTRDRPHLRRRTST
jgi:hypothetical protein